MPGLCKFVWNFPWSNPNQECLSQSECSMHKKVRGSSMSGKALNAKMENTVGNQVNKHRCLTLKFCQELALLNP